LKPTITIAAAPQQLIPDQLPTDYPHGQSVIAARTATLRFHFLSYQGLRPVMMPPVMGPALGPVFVTPKAPPVDNNVGLGATAVTPPGPPPLVSAGVVPPLIVDPNVTPPILIPAGVVTPPNVDPNMAPPPLFAPVAVPPLVPVPVPPS
jgi:hypothetical protein